MSSTKPTQHGGGNDDGDDDDGRLAALIGDERAQSVTLGAILLFGVLVMALGIYQAFAVPAQNEEVEFKHNLDLQGEFQDLRGTIHSAALRGDGGSVDVALGTTYPTRMFAINPPPASGRLQSVDPGGNITIGNATALDGETADYWNGDDQPFETRYLSYEDNYHAYNSAPETVYENSVVYNLHQNDENTTVTGQNIVQGNTITLTALDGDLSESGVTAESIDVQAASAPARTVAMKDDGGPITIEMPTRLSEDRWDELLADQIDGGHVAEDPEVDSRVLTITLEEGETYNFRMAKVGVGSDVDTGDSHYLVDVSGDGGSVSESGTRELVVEVRDEFNNPVTGETVNLSLVDNDDNEAVGHLEADGVEDQTLTDIKTGDDGQAIVSYQPENINGASADIDIRASMSETPSTDPDEEFDSGDRENVLFEINVENTDRSGTDDEDDELINPPGEVSEVVFIDSTEGYDATVTFKNNYGEERSWERARFAFLGGSQDLDNVSGASITVEEEDTLDMAAEDYTEISADVSFAGDSEDTVDISLDGVSGNPKGEFIVLQIQYDNDEVRQYFIPLDK